MDNATCAQAMIGGALLQAIAGDYTAPILLMIVVVAVVADLWKGTTE